MYQYIYDYGSSTGMIFPLLYFFLFLGTAFVAVIEYIFLGMGLYRMAANRNHPSPWMAFVPFARTYLRGELSGDIYLKKSAVKNPGLLLVLMPIAYSVIVGCMFFVCFLFMIFGASVMINGGSADVILVLALALCIPILLLSVVYKALMSVLNVLVDYQIYRRYMPLHFAVIHAVLGIFIPLYRGVYLFYIRKRPCHGMGQPGSAEVPSENTEPSSEEQSVQPDKTDCGESAGKEDQ